MKYLTFCVVLAVLCYMSVGLGSVTPRQAQTHRYKHHSHKMLRFHFIKCQYGKNHLKSKLLGIYNSLSARLGEILTEKRPNCPKDPSWNAPTPSRAKTDEK